MSEEVETKTAEKKKKSDLIPRLVTSVVMIPILLGMIFPGPHWLWALFIGVAAAVGMYEYFGMLQKGEPRAVRLASTGFGLAFVVTLYVFIGPRPLVSVGAAQYPILLGALAGILWLNFLFNLMRDRDISRVAVTMSSGVTGVFYGGFTFALIAMLKRDFGDVGAGWILMLLALAWLSDTGAYFAGRAFGKHKLAPSVSPKKTIEGAAGGLAGSILAGFVVSYLFLDFLSVADILLLSIVGNVLGQTGDLCESLLKRSVGVKDSGTIIHGHGGMLDRVDAVLFISPWVYIFAYLTNGTPLIG